jgi:tRNA modification GTPase
MREVRQAELTSVGIVPDTIFAPASGTDRAAIAVVRLSGPAAHEALRALTRRDLPPWRELALRRVLDAGGEVIDRAMVVAFPEGASYTGEAMAEIHCHGSRAVVADLLNTLAALPHCRLAEPGEFTQRAFLGGRMDLSEVEGLSDLIAAETSEQRRQALRMHAGAVSGQVETWRALLLRARALIEVTIDWADEDVPVDVMPEVRALLQRLQEAMQAELSRSEPAERLRCGFEVAIVGPPNVGKSSLLNAIAGREAAIVSEIAGTTRDVLEVRFDLSGLPVLFLDTAGIRDAQDAVERLGVERARARAMAADLRVIMSSPDTTAADHAEFWRDGDLRVWSKCDLGSGKGDVAISAVRGDGLDRLLELLKHRLAERVRSAGLLGRVRQRLAVEEAVAHVRHCCLGLDRAEAEQNAEELRLAARALDRLIGRIDVEEVLNEVFSSFCLGK